MSTTRLQDNEVYDQMGNALMSFQIEFLIIAVFGLALGSFTSALVYRIPRGIPWATNLSKEKKAVWQRSACPSCRANLTAIDLFPVFSWLFLKGRCRHCKSRISARYPLIELSVLLACMGAYLTLGFTYNAFFMIAAIPFLCALLVIDLDHMILPDQLVLIVAAIGVARLVFEFFQVNMNAGIYHVLVPHLSGALIFAGLSWSLKWFLSKILKRDSLGFGDIKFFAVVGLWLGIANIAWFFILSGFMGAIFAIFWKTATKKDVFPFGPALITSLYVLLLFEGSLLI